MKRILLPSLLYLLLDALIPILYGCADTPPEKQTGTITFIITEENTPQALSGVSVQLFSDFDTSVMPTDRTDNSGRCTFSDIPVGTYKMSISKPGYESKSDISLRINGGNNPYMEISLKRSTTELTVSPSILDFGEDESLIQKAFSLVNPNYEDLTWAVLDTEVPWIISVCDKDGKKSGIIKYNQEVAMSVTIDRSKLSGVSNESTIVILSDHGRAELKIKVTGADLRIPKMSIENVKEIKTNSAIFTGKVEFQGAPEYSVRGFVYGTSSITSLEDKDCTVLSVPKSLDSCYAVEVSDLIKGTKYYVRSYAINDVGVSLSANEETFITCTELTTVATLDVETLYAQNGRAILRGRCTSGGNPIYVERGFCYNTTGEPDINDTKVIVSGSDTDVYDYILSPLEDNMTYYIRAYAMQNNRIEYGDVVVFSTHPRPVKVATRSVSNFTDYGTVTLNGMIVDVGFPNYYERGFCYATHNNPTINDVKLSIVGDDYSIGEYSFEEYIGSNTYFYRAYAMQGNEVVYGDVLQISKEQRVAAVKTETKRVISRPFSVLYGTVLETGYPIISERGIEYGKTSQPSSSWQKKSDMYRSDGEYAIELLLDEGELYYYRAYVIQDGVKICGSIYDFRTYQTPIIYTEEVYSYEYNSESFLYSIELSGIEFKTAYPECTEYGFIYSLSPDVEIGNIGSIKLPAQSIGIEDGFKVFRYKLDSLYGNDTYYFRAYAISDGQYYYGDVESVSIERE